MNLDAEQLGALFQESIAEAKLSTSEDEGRHPFVGAILANSEGNIIARAHRGDVGPGTHAEYSLLQKIKDLDVDLSSCTLFVTLEPCTTRGPAKTPCARRIADSGIPAIYVGMMDPDRAIHGEGIRFLRSRGLRVEHFPHVYVEQLEALNHEFISSKLRERLPYEHFFVASQTSELIADYLQRSGVDIDDLPEDWGATLSDVERCAESSRGKIGMEQLVTMLRQARADAFTRKYADQTYDEDARAVSDDWQNAIRRVLSLHGASDWTQRRLLVVGIGNGLEAQGFMDSCKWLTGVDISQKAIVAARRRLPAAQLCVGEAEELSMIESGSQDIYLSCRTYQSSYFDVASALREAHRVLRSGGLLVVSISNGYKRLGGGIVPGMLIPRTNVADPHRPWDLVNEIRRRLHTLKFEAFGIQTTLAEIFLYSKKTR